MTFSFCDKTVDSIFKRLKRRKSMKTLMSQMQIWATKTEQMQWLPAQLFPTTRSKSTPNDWFQRRKACVIVSRIRAQIFLNCDRQLPIRDNQVDSLWKKSVTHSSFNNKMLQRQVAVISRSNNWSNCILKVGRLFRICVLLRNSRMHRGMVQLFPHRLQTHPKI